jgi:hypothetical protein
MALAAMATLVLLTGCSTSTAHRPSGPPSPVTVIVTVPAPTTPTAKPKPTHTHPRKTPSQAPTGQFKPETLHQTGEDPIYDGCGQILIFALNTTGHDQKATYTFDAVFELTDLYNRTVFKEVPNAKGTVTFPTVNAFGNQEPSGKYMSTISVCPPVAVSSLGTLRVMRWRVLTHTP